jgi:hypothetical protein
MTIDEPTVVTPEFAIFGVRTVDGVKLIASTELTDAALIDHGIGGARFAGAADRVLVVTGKTYASAVRALLDHFDFPDLMNSPFQPGAASE